MKGKIFSKLKDYNHILDKMLEEKNFSEDAKNLLLSMIYKIENSYNTQVNHKTFQENYRNLVGAIVNQDYKNA